MSSLSHSSQSRTSTKKGASKPASKFGVTSFTLKIAAIITMTCNHIANVFAGVMPDWLTLLLYSLGGTTFPIFAFLLVEGYHYTSSLRRYAYRLAIFAAISQIPYTLLWGWKGNVILTLLIGLGILYLDDRWSKGLQRLWFWLVFIAALFVSDYCDWGLVGIVLIFLFRKFAHTTRGTWKVRRGGIAFAMILLILYSVIPLAIDLNDVITSMNQGMNLVITADVSNEIYQAGILVGYIGGILYYCVGSTIALILLLFYNGQLGHSLKMLFYAYYPAHLFVLWVISVCMGINPLPVF